MIALKTICCFSVFNFEFDFLQRYCTTVASLCVIGAILLQMCHRLLATLRQICYGGDRRQWQPSGKFVIGCQRVLTNSSEGIGGF